MSINNAKGRLDWQDGDPATGFVTAARIKTAFDDLGSAWATDIAASGGGGGPVLVTRSGGVWKHNGATVATRPTAVYANGAYVIWDTSQDATFVDPPPLAVPGDKWTPHPSVGV